MAVGPLLPADPPSGATDTTKTFEDVDGNGNDDDCQDPAAVADPVAAAAALAAADLDHDGTISVSEAAQSGWTGGKNCNHGGYVSGIAHDSGDPADTSTGRRQGQPARGLPRGGRATPRRPATRHRPTRRLLRTGKAVSEVAQSDAVGGKNCNHGGAVSAAAKKDHSGPHGKSAAETHGKGKGKGHGQH